MSEKDWNIETLAVQAGYNPGKGEPRVAPIAQSTTYAYENSQQVEDLFNLVEAGHIYSRISNPTVEVFENKMAALEGGVGAVACSSGQTATTVALLNLANSGDHIVSGTALYGGSFNLLKHTFKKLGIDVTFVDLNESPEVIKAAFRENTKGLYAESLANPSMHIVDFEKISGIAKEMQVPLVIDNTLPTPYLCNPLKHGADIVIHSSTKYIDGHATAVGGVIIDGGTFDWTNGKFPEFTEPDPSYHGLSYVEALKEAAYIAKARVQYIRDVGCYLSPMNAWLSNLGLETLHVRMDRHCENALKIAEYLEKHPKISWVAYPGLKSCHSHDLANKYLKGGSGVLAFGVEGGEQAGKDVIDKLELIRIVVHVADLRSSILHPATSTHRQLNDEDLAKTDVTRDMLRLSVGIENVDDLIADLEQALK